MKMPFWVPVAVEVILAIISSVFVVNEGQTAIVINMGKLVRIDNVRTFYRATGGDESVAVQRLAPIIKNALKLEINSRTLLQAISADRLRVVAKQLDAINKGAATIG